MDKIMVLLKGDKSNILNISFKNKDIEKDIKEEYNKAIDIINKLKHLIRVLEIKNVELNNKLSQIKNIEASYQDKKDFINLNDL
jgi:hypothetical protein